MIGTSELDAFVRQRQWAVMTTLRGNGEPASSVVGYAVDRDALVVGASDTTLKVRCLSSDPRVVLCVFSNEAQPKFATIEGIGSIQREGIDEAKSLVLSKTVPLGHSPSAIESWLSRPDTRIIRVRPTRVWGVLSSAV